MVDKKLLAAFDMIVKARNQIKGCKFPSESTQEKYSQAVKRMSERNLWPEEIANTKRTYYFYRAALIQSTRVAIIEYLRHINKLQKAKETDWIQDMSTLQYHLNILERYPYDPAKVRLKNGEKCRWTKEGKSPKSNGKRKGLGSLPADWQKQIWEALPKKSTYRLAIAVLSCSGCRPSELEKGVHVYKDNEGNLILEILGSKTYKGTHGQQERVLIIEPTTPEAKFLLSELSHCVENKIEVKISSGKNLSEAVRRHSKHTWPRRKYIVSPYSYRHQFGADLKEYLTPEEIAQALGHSVDRTQQFYGTRNQSRGGVKLVKVTASSPVKHTASKPMTEKPSHKPTPIKYPKP